VKKLILLAALAAGVAYVVKFKSGQVKSAATKVTHDPRVQSALATASEKAGPVVESVSSATTAAASAVADHLHTSDGLSTPGVPDEAVDLAEADPVSAPEFTATEPPKVETADIEPAERQPDPLTDPLTDPMGADEGSDSGEAPEK
jgi:hypothetical protein